MKENKMSKNEILFKITVIENDIVEMKMYFEMEDDIIIKHFLLEKINKLEKEIKELERMINDFDCE